jgi:pyruvate,water dikinase
MGEESVTVWDGVPGFEFIPEVDLHDFHSWFLDGTHSVPPWTHLFGWFWVNHCPHGTKAVCDVMLSIPTCKGWEMRYKNGGSYNAFHIVRDKAEIAEREKKFRVAIRPYLENFDGFWADGKKELLGMYQKLKELDVDHATTLELFHHHHDLIETYARMWEIHHEGLFSSHAAYLMFAELCQEKFGISDQDPAFQNMLRGFPNKIYQMDKDMWQFGQLALKMKLGDTFRDNEPEALLVKLKQEARGKEWLEKFMGYMNTDEVGGWRMRRANDFTEPYWLEDPATPIGVVRNYIIQGAGYVLEATQDELAKQRKEAIAAFLNKVPPMERELYRGLIDLSGKISAFSEEHDLYCELMVQALMRRGYLAMGRRMAEKGTIDLPEDIFFLSPDEIDRVILVPGSYDMRWFTRRRRAELEGWMTERKAPIITNRDSFEEAVEKDLMDSKDAVAIKIIVGEQPRPKPGVKADLWGLTGCGGQAEGIARVAIRYEDLKNVKPGEILVCANTNPAWSPVFGIVSAIVTDSGGTLCHAAIIARENNVPIVLNTQTATQTIKTGQRIRVDATNGAVFILDK